MSRLTLADIRARIAEKHGLTVAEIKSSSLKRRITRARHAFMWEARQSGKWSNLQIARAVGLEDHTSTVHGVKAHAAALACEPKAPYRRTALPDGIITLEGSMDGIRFGRMRVGGKVRGFLHDRLNGVVRLFEHDPENDGRREDKDSGRLALAKAMLDLAWAQERAGRD